MDKTNAMAESRKRKIKELTDEFEEIKHKEILKDGIEKLVKEEIKEIEEGLLSQYFSTTMNISLLCSITYIVFSQITKRVIHKWKR